MVDMEEKRYTAEEVSDLYGVKVDTVRRWIRVGDLAAVYLGSQAGYRVAESDLRAFELKRRVRSKVRDEMHT